MQAFLYTSTPTLFERKLVQLNWFILNFTISVQTFYKHYIARVNLNNFLLKTNLIMYS